MNYNLNDGLALTKCPVTILVIIKMCAKPSNTAPTYGFLDFLITRQITVTFSELQSRLKTFPYVVHITTIYVCRSNFSYSINSIFSAAFSLTTVTFPIYLFLDWRQPGSIRSMLLVTFGWLVGNAVFSETAVRIFLIFLHEVRGLQRQKSDRTGFLKKIFDLEIFAKRSSNQPKISNNWLVG